MEILSLLFPSRLTADRTAGPQGDERRCANCGTAVQGHYCHHCGQRQRTEQDYRLLSFIRHSFHEFTDLDSKAFRSLRYLLFRPGKLTAEWHAGKEGSYIKPLRLFLFVNVIYFIFYQFYPISTIVNPLDIQYFDEPYSPTIQHFVNQRLAETHQTYQQFAVSYDALSATESKSLVILMAPLFAVLLALLYYVRISRVRRKLHFRLSRHYFVHHLVFSLHFYAFFLLLISIGDLAISALTGQVLHLIGHSTHEYAINWDAVFTLSDGAIIFLYLVFALRNVYGGKLWATVIRSALLSYATLYVLFAYRLILFFTTFYSMPHHRWFS